MLLRVNRLDDAMHGILILPIELPMQTLCQDAFIAFRLSRRVPRQQPRPIVLQDQATIAIKQTRRFSIHILN